MKNSICKLSSFGMNDSYLKIKSPNLLSKSCNHSPVSLLMMTIGIFME